MERQFKKVDRYSSAVLSEPIRSQVHLFFSAVIGGRNRGRVAKQADRMVLTDSDFGSAYLTEGWATRFLQRLFTHNVVMFIGYSHSHCP
jgi:hypothetical protein